MNFKNIILEKQGNVSVVTINRPKALNALNTETLLELNSAFDEIANDNDVYAVVITGETAKYGNILLKKGVTPVE